MRSCPYCERLVHVSTRFEPPNTLLDLEHGTYTDTMQMSPHLETVDLETVVDHVLAWWLPAVHGETR